MVFLLCRKRQFRLLFMPEMAVQTASLSFHQLSGKVIMEME